MTDSIGQKILVLIPAYNEGERVAPVVRQALASYPVLVVDDGSTDRTATFAEAAGAEVLAQRPNQGKGTALLTGFAAALERDYQAVITLDADGQHDPAEIPSFAAAFHEAGADLVIGRRDFRRMPLVRRVSNSLGTLLFSRALGQPVPDNQSGYRLLSRRMLQAMMDSPQRGFEFEVEMIVTCVLKGYKLAWVPIRTIYGGEISHIRPLRHLAKFLQITYKTGQAVRAARASQQEYRA